MATSSDNSIKLQIPIIDISRSDIQVGDVLVNAVAKHGFVLIKSTDLLVTGETVDKIFDVNKGCLATHRETFDPEHQKHGDFKDLTDKSPERLTWRNSLKEKPQQPLPKTMIPPEADLGAFAGSCQKPCLRLLELFAMGLKIDAKHGGAGWFSSYHDQSKGPSGCTLRLLYVMKWLKAKRTLVNDAGQIGTQGNIITVREYLRSRLGATYGVV